MYLDRLAASIRAALACDDVRIDRSRRPGHGDLGTPSAIACARRSGRPPMDVAADLARRLEETPEIERAWAVDPGFVNVRLTTAALADIASEIAQGASRFAEPASSEPASSEAISSEAIAEVHRGLADVLRWARDLGLSPTVEAPEVLAPPAERGLVCALATCRGTAAQLTEIAETLLPRTGVDHRALPRGDEVPTGAHRTRLTLVAATEVVLRSGLGVLGHAYA